MGLREKGFLVIFIFLIAIPEINFALDKTIDSKKNAWVDSLLNTLTIDEKIGQLLMIPVYLKMKIISIGGNLSCLRNGQSMIRLNNIGILDRLV